MDKKISEWDDSGDWDDNEEWNGNDENSIDFNYSPSPKKRKVEKKRDTEFEIKKKVATEVSKYRNLFDITHRKYPDKTVEAASWICQILSSNT